MTTPCPNCVETIADLRQAVSDAIHNAYVSGALDVHNNYQEDRDPSFGEAAADYVASLDVNDMLAKFLPKSPAQLLAEECPHGMTEEQAQWVLDREATCKQSLQVQPDTAPRYVFGPWVMYDEHPPKECIEIDVGHAPGTYRRAYRIGQSYTHDGGECPLADGSVVVFAEFNHGVEGNYTASKIHWRNVTSFTPLVQGTGQ